jgi:hypothetical protein
VSVPIHHPVINHPIHEPHPVPELHVPVVRPPWAGQDGCRGRVKDVEKAWHGAHLGWKTNHGGGAAFTTTFPGHWLRKCCKREHVEINRDLMASKRLEQRPLQIQFERKCSFVFSTLAYYHKCTAGNNARYSLVLSHGVFLMGNVFFKSRCQPVMDGAASDSEVPIEV